MEQQKKLMGTVLLARIMALISKPKFRPCIVRFSLVVSVSIETFSQGKAPKRGSCFKRHDKQLRLIEHTCTVIY